MVEISQSGSGEGFGYSTNSVPTSGPPRGDACVAYQSRRMTTLLLRALAPPRCDSRCGHVLAVRGTEAPGWQGAKYEHSRSM
jgi:hypothetical protein